MQISGFHGYELTLWYHELNTFHIILVSYVPIDVTSCYNFFLTWHLSSYYLFQQENEIAANP